MFATNRGIGYWGIDKGDINACNWGAAHSRDEQSSSDDGWSRPTFSERRSPPGLAGEPQRAVVVEATTGKPSACAGIGDLTKAI